jgi:hypothetical protein
MAQLILKGIPPYTHAYTMKLPGVALCYALFMSIFGESAIAIRIGLMLVNAACTGLVYALGKQFFSGETALTAAAYYALLSLSQSVMGTFAHATHFVVLFSLPGIFLLGRGLITRQTTTIFLSGICFGLAFLMKQHAVILIPFVLFFQVWTPTKGNKRLFLKDGCILLLGVAAPYIVVAIWLFDAGVFDRFWFWTFQYAREYAAGLSIADGFKEFTSQFTSIIMPNLLIWSLAGVGVIAIYRKRKTLLEGLFLIGYLTASFLMICPGFYFRPHYFVLLLPPIALLAAFATTSSMNIPGKVLAHSVKAIIPAFLLTTTSVYSLVAEKDYLFTLAPQEVSRRIYGTNPFPEAVEIASYLRRHTTINDSIAILGSEPEILFYADRLSATGHIYMYGLMENQRYAEEMQDQLVTEIEKTAPAYIVVVHNSTSWLLRPNSLNKVLDWGDSYIPLRYDEVGIVDIFGDKPTRYVWGTDVAGYEPIAESFVSIFRRRL